MHAFAVLTATEHEVYDALDTRQWNFWVLSAAQVQETNQASMGLAKVIKLAGMPADTRIWQRNREGARR